MRSEPVIVTALWLTQCYDVIVFLARGYGPFPSDLRRHLHTWLTMAIVVLMSTVIAALHLHVLFAHAQSCPRT